MVHIGNFAVDSGQAMIGDPCYLDEWKPWDSTVDKFEDHPKHAGEYGYLGACNATLTEGYGELNRGSGVVFTTGYGDGLYPVYAIMNEDGRIAGVFVDFVGVVEDEDFDEDEFEDEETEDEE
jgi:hypothetical protein